MISLDEAIGRVRGAYDVLLEQELKSYAAILRRHTDNAAEIFKAVAERRDELIAERDQQLQRFRAEMMAERFQDVGGRIN